jgi:hypothetical protein
MEGSNMKCSYSTNTYYAPCHWYEAMRYSGVYKILRSRGDESSLIISIQGVLIYWYHALPEPKEGYTGYIGGCNQWVTGGEVRLQFIRRYKHIDVSPSLIERTKLIQQEWVPGVVHI